MIPVISVKYLHWSRVLLFLIKFSCIFTLTPYASFFLSKNSQLSDENELGHLIIAFLKQTKNRFFHFSGRSPLILIYSWLKTWLVQSSKTSSWKVLLLLVGKAQARKKKEIFRPFILICINFGRLLFLVLQPLPPRPSSYGCLLWKQKKNWKFTAKFGDDDSLGHNCWDFRFPFRLLLLLLLSSPITRSHSPKWVGVYLTNSLCATWWWLQQSPAAASVANEIKGPVESREREWTYEDS